MKRSPGTRRRPAVHISLGRASRLHRLVTILHEAPRTRDELLAELKIGLRTFYRELELLRRCGVKVRLDRRQYRLSGTVGEAEDRLPFPDPQLSFAEMAELADCPGDAARRLKAMLEGVVASSPRSSAPGPARRAGMVARKPRGGG